MARRCVSGALGSSPSPGAVEASPSPSRGATRAGPLLLKSMTPGIPLGLVSVEAPTDNTSGSPPGNDIVDLAGPAFPAAATTRTPFSVAALMASCMAGEYSAAPRLMLITSAPWFTAHSIPAITQLSHPHPYTFSTLTSSRYAPGATPLSTPGPTVHHHHLGCSVVYSWLAAPVPAAMLATWVPCQCMSHRSADSPGTKLTSPMTFGSSVVGSSSMSSRSGWLSSIPVSSMAITTP